MGHCINAFIGKSDIIERLAQDWLKSKQVIPLKQGYSMLYLTGELFDDMTELVNQKNDLDYSALQYFTTAIFEVMQTSSFHSMLAYIETDYFGGNGTQAGVLFENGKIIIEPTIEDYIINRILHKLGVCKEKGKDQFDSLNLGNYRRML